MLLDEAVVISPSQIQEADMSAIKALEHRLHDNCGLVRLIFTDGQEFIFPESLAKMFCDMVQAVASGQTISIVPSDKELTTQTASELLKVSRPFLIKLLNQGEIPFTKVGSHRRIRFQDIMEYKKDRDTQRNALLDELTQMNLEAGCYDL